MAKVASKRLNTIEEQSIEISSLESISIDCAKPEKVIAIKKKR